tara:strand:- start:4763 stop:5404 length:642 start_codon:yes stop_codon:yes gene_type:complete
MSRNDLQSIVVLCAVIVAVVSGGLLIAHIGAESTRSQIDPPSMQLDTSLDDVDPQEMPPSDMPGYTEPVPAPEPVTPITSFDECVAAGNPVMESYPRQCRAGEETFVEEIDEPVACTADAKMCPDGSFVGRVGPDCQFEACPVAELPEQIECTEEQKQAVACTMEYMPVCGLVDVQCFTEPCDPVPQTFGNKCSACAQGNVISYSVGECQKNG